jgi:light-regulated signal transduction histidine kinase (bacteriophytochrome)
MAEMEQRSDAPVPLSPLRHLPRTIALIYLAAGVFWIFVTDHFLLWLKFEPARFAQWQTYKGWLFVFGSALLLYAVLRRYQGRDQIAVAALLESKQEMRRLNVELERRVAERTRQLESMNRELESFAYAISHDLRAPLRSLSGFSQILQDTTAAGLDEKSKHYLQRIHDAAQRMSTLIEDLLGLSRITRAEFAPRLVILSQICVDAAATIRERYPARDVKIDVQPNMEVQGDARLLRIMMENLLDNAWKYTANVAQAQVSVGMQTDNRGPICYVRDNGAGFDMAYSDKLFAPFQRLHSEAEFAGSGIGLVIVQRIVARHGGRIWAEAAVNRGATFYFTIGHA